MKIVVFCFLLAVYLGSFVNRVAEAAFAHWNDWSVANAGDNAGGLLILVGLAIPFALAVWWVFGWIGRIRQRSSVAE